MELSWLIPAVVGAVVVGGSIVIVFAWRSLGGTRFGYEVPSTGAAGAGFDSEAGAIDASERCVDLHTEVTFE